MTTRLDFEAFVKSCPAAECRAHLGVKGFKFGRKGSQARLGGHFAANNGRKVGKSRLSVISTNFCFSLSDHLTLASPSYPMIIHSMQLVLSFMIGYFDFMLQLYPSIPTFHDTLTYK